MIVKILPVLRYWMVVLWLMLVPLVADCIVPVGIGSSLPTWILAGRLSVARTEGEERTLTLESVIRTFMKERTSCVPTTAPTPCAPGPAAPGGPARPVRIEAREPNSRLN